MLQQAELDVFGPSTGRVGCFWCFNRQSWMFLVLQQAELEVLVLQQAELGVFGASTGRVGYFWCFNRQNRMFLVLQQAE